MIIKNKEWTFDYESSPHSTVADIQSEISKRKNMKPERIRLLLKQSILDPKTTISSLNLEPQDVIICKDLGPQIGWKTVFLVEYFGPIVIHYIFYTFSQFIYGSNNMSLIQQLAFYMACFHFIKRELETEFVHRFSNGTMPLINLPKNCFHYWVLGGIFIAYPLYSPKHVPVYQLSTPIVALFTLVWFFAQCSNLKTHLILRNLRQVGTKDRNIPFGYGFDLLSCPNYFFEILGWICFSIITGSLYGI
jgi:very-long-chain enoyl-CoA reductase